MGSSGRRVLVVEDDEDVRVIADIALARLGGFAVVSVGTADAARAALSEAVPDVMLLDVELPDIDGPSFAAEVAGRPELAAMPIILMTGHAFPDPPPHVLGVISKPFDAMKLAEQVRAMCGWA